MGDGGSYLLGFTSAILCILLSSDNSFVGNYTSMIIPFMVLFLPIGDMIYVIFLRILKGNMPFYGDRQHLHHRLLRFGISHENTVKVVLIINIFICLITLFYFYF